MIQINPDVAVALRNGQPVVALESTLISHGLPWPVNLDTARAADAAVREEGAVPATVAVWEGQPLVGLSDAQLEKLARTPGVLKASRRDLAVAVSQQRTAATTVAATMHLAHLAGIRLFATGGIGGAHRPPADPWDISADLLELSRTPVAVVCAGAKNVLDIPRTLEILESQSVPVVGYQTDTFPAFYLSSSGHAVSARVDSPEDAAAFLGCHWKLGGAGVVVAQPVAEDVVLGEDEFSAARAEAERRAEARQVRGPALTPFLLAALAEISDGRTLRANQSLIVANARLAASISRLTTAG